MSARGGNGMFFLLAALAVAITLGVKQVSDVVGGWKAGGERYLPTLNATERKYGLPTDLLARMAYQESHWRDDIVSGATASSAGALGLMQLVPKWHPNVNPLNWPQAVDYAGAFLKGLYRQFGSWQLAVAAYNAGAGNVTKYQGVPPFTETQNYVSSVFRDIPSVV